MYLLINHKLFNVVIYLLIESQFNELVVELTTRRSLATNVSLSLVPSQVFCRYWKGTAFSNLVSLGCLCLVVTTNMRNNIAFACFQVLWLCCDVYARDQLSPSGNVSNLETRGFIVTFFGSYLLLPQGRLKTEPCELICNHYRRLNIVI